MISKDDNFGFIKTNNDAHTLGLTNIGNLIKDCGLKVYYFDKDLVFDSFQKIKDLKLFNCWLEENKITHLGFSYRLDPNDAFTFFEKIYVFLKQNEHISENGGLIKKMYFGGLPSSSMMIKSKFKSLVSTFDGSETQFESLLKIGIDQKKIPDILKKQDNYTISLRNISEKFINNKEYEYSTYPKIQNYKEMGKKNDNVMIRLSNAIESNALPLIRAHIGSYNKNYKYAIKETLTWLNELADSNLLDIASIATSQLTQSHFQKNWNGLPNGGGIPLNTIDDLNLIYNSSRPMLLRAYSSTDEVLKNGILFDNYLNMAWHALSFWWFNILDGRGPNSLEKSLRNHFELLRWLAKNNRLFEPNVPHHFAFRGSDDFTFILSGFLAAKAAKLKGIKVLILQSMLNTPKTTPGIIDIIKNRTLYKLVKSLESDNFKVLFQPRAGLDFFSPDINLSKIQLGQSTMLMDDIVYETNQSPEIIHVVSYSEGRFIASSKEVIESTKITKGILSKYRKLKQSGFRPLGFDMDEIDFEVNQKIMNLNKIIKFLENEINDLYSPKGFYEIFKAGVLPVPYLWKERLKYENAIDYNVKSINGSYQFIDCEGKPIDPCDRIMTVVEKYKSL